MKRPANLRELSAVFENPEKRAYKQLTGLVTKDIKAGKKQGDWIWYLYPQSEEDVKHIKKVVHYEYTNKKRENFERLFRSKSYQDLFQKVNVQDLGWFDDADRARVRAFQKRNAALIASVSPGAAPAAGPASLAATASVIVDFARWIVGWASGARGRTHWYALQTEAARSKIYATKTRRRVRTDVQTISLPDGGMQNYGSKFDHHSVNIGAMIAGNNGRPGGAVGEPGGIATEKVHAGHKTQEEDVVSSWLLSERAETKIPMAEIFQSTVGPMWGMRSPKGYDTATIQGFNYKANPGNGASATDYANAWVVRDAFLSPKYYKNKTKKEGPRFDLKKRFPATLVFVAGPNANPDSEARSPKSTMRRTYSKVANENYGYFRAALKEAVRAGLDAMAAENVDIALIAGVSTALYAGPWKKRIAGDFLPLCYEIANEPVGPNGEMRGEYFERIVYPTL